jgi:hypothetical protein
MTIKRIAAAAILALFPFAAHATVPPVPDADRYASFTLSSPTTVVGVPFAVYGDCSDIQVLSNGVALALNSQWTCASASGVALNLQSLPITDMQVTLSPSLSSGTLEIIGAWHPRNTTIPTAPGITRQEYEQEVNTLTSSLREVKQFAPSFPETAGYVLTSAGPGIRPIWAPASPTSIGEFPAMLAVLPSTSNPAMTLNVAGETLSASGIAATTCGGVSSFGFTCMQLFSITGDTVDSSELGAIDGWQFNYKIGAGVKGARQGVDIIMDFTAPSSATNPNRNYVPLTTYMQIDSGDGGTLGNEKGAFFGANFVVRGAASHVVEVAGQENDVNVVGTALYRFGYTAASFPGAEGSLGDAAYEVHAASGALATNWVNGFYLSNLGGLAPISAGGCVICTDGTHNTIYKGMDLSAYTITGYFLKSSGFQVDGVGNTKVAGLTLASTAISGQAATIASGFCTSPSITANGTAAFSITVGSACAAGNASIALPPAAHGWSCNLQDITGAATHVIAQYGYTATSASFQDYSRTTGSAQVMGSGDVIAGQCMAF